MPFPEELHFVHLDKNNGKLLAVFTDANKAAAWSLATLDQHIDPCPLNLFTNVIPVEPDPPSTDE